MMEYVTFFYGNDFHFDHVALALNPLVELLICFDCILRLWDILVNLAIFEIIVERFLVESVDLELAIMWGLFSLDMGKFFNEIFVLIEDLLRLPHSILFYNYAEYHQ